jgi:N-acetyl-gamma-glutamyl-phosphate reductase
MHRARSSACTSIFGTGQPVLPLRSSGTGAMTAAVCSLFSPGEKALVVEGGKFGERSEVRFVRGTMFCDIALVVDPRTERLIIVSVIDNLCRGASGQAIANANLLSGLPLQCGLTLPPLVPWILPGHCPKVPKAGFRP